MAGKADFTQDEWKTLSKGVTGAGMLVSLAHRGLERQLRRGDGPGQADGGAAHPQPKSARARAGRDTRHGIRA